MTPACPAFFTWGHIKGRIRVWSECCALKAHSKDPAPGTTANSLTPGSHIACQFRYNPEKGSHKFPIIRLSRPIVFIIVYML